MFKGLKNRQNDRYGQAAERNVVCLACRMVKRMEKKN